jgi:hypothetical protein
MHPRVIGVLRLGRSPWSALGAFALLAIIHTWPLASNPAHLSRVDNADYSLNAWAVSWVAHQLPRDPRHLFDANIFHPEPLTLAYSEAMIVQGVMAIPLRAVGASPVATFNILFVLGLALTGWAFCLLVVRWTGSWSAGYIAGSLAAFNSSVLVRLPHLQTQHVEFVALMLFALDRLFVSQRFRDAVLLGLAWALHGMTSIYLLVFSIWMLPFAVIGGLGAWGRKRPLVTIALLTAAAAIGIAMMWPYLSAYRQLHDRSGFERTVYDAELFAGRWVDYLATGSRLHYTLWSSRFFEMSRSPSFPGVVGLALAGLGLAWRETRRDSRVQMCLAAALGCLAVSFAPHLSFYPTLHRAIPLFRAVRVPAHLGQMVLMMLAVIAGFGAAGLGRRWPNDQSWPVVALALVLVINVESLRAPIGWRRFDGIPKIYTDLAGVPNAIVAELPLTPPTWSPPMSLLMIYSTAHWHPMLNGYSGFQPQSYRDTYQAAEDFPSDSSLIALHQRGVTHVFVHRQELGEQRFAAIRNIASLQWQNDDGEIYLYKLR